MNVIYLLFRMNKLQKLLKGISILLKKPSYLNNIINENDVWKTSFEKKYPKQSAGLPVVDLIQVIEEKRININCYSYLNGGSLVTDLALLKGLSKLIPHCNYFEIGTWRGESVVNVAEHAILCDTLNLSKQEMRDLKISPNIINQVGIFIGDQTNIRCIEGNTFSFDFEGLNQKYDLIFIDGDHKYNAICNDTSKVISHLIHDKSIVVWHDYTYSPDVIRYEVYKAILDSVPTSLHHCLYHVRNTNCCILHQSLSAPIKQLQYPDIPYFNFKIEVLIESRDIH